MAISVAVIVALYAFLPGNLFENPQMLQFQIMMAIMTLPKLYVVLIGVVSAILYAFFILFMQAATTVLFLNLDYSHRAVQTRETDTPRVMIHQATVAPTQVETNLGVTHASIKIQENNPEHTTQHLEQVYDPTPHLQQAVPQEDEDRMPTLLFDDELAKQLAAHEQETHATTNNKPDQDQEPPSIKISGKPL